MQKLMWMVCAFGLAGLMFKTLVLASPQFTQYDIDTMRSEVRILVMRDGTLSGVSHNHVIVSKDIKGKLNFSSENPLVSQFQFSFEVEKLIVDDPANRKQEGEDFAAELSASDMESIRENMLGEDVLDAKKFPQITINSQKIEGELPSLNLTVRINLHGVEKDFVVPVKIKIDDQNIHAHGEIKLKQSAFNIKPLSILFGAIKVQDELLIKFNLFAHKS